MEKRMLKNWSKLTGHTDIALPSCVYIDCELTRGQMRAWMLKSADRSDYTEWMPTTIEPMGPKILINYANVVKKLENVHLTLTVMGDKCEITEWNGNEFKVTPVKKGSGM